jgi:hypothetical protein
MSFEFKRSKDDLRRIAFARVRDAAYDAVSALWLKRKAEGMTQLDIAQFLERDPSWVSRNLAGPANWTLKTFGELTEALNGHAFIVVEPKEHIVPDNFDIYTDIDEFCVNLEPLGTVIEEIGGGNVVNITFADHNRLGVFVQEPEAKAYAG